MSRSAEYQNELQRPVLFGTRRIGPDLCREGGRRSNDWHAVTFYKPDSLSQESPMPEYPWFFDGSADKPNARGLAIMTTSSGWAHGGRAIRTTKPTSNRHCPA
ncbi:MAG: cbb3-type cytochrome c oxidase subunit II [Planctomycetaceae bacterium]